MDETSVAIRGDGVGGNKLGMSGLTVSLLLDNTELRLGHS
jgi:hypothetical protein